MNKEELKTKLKELEIENTKNRSAIFKDYAFSNNPYEIGDIIEDHCQIIKIETIGFTISFISEVSECIYKGTLLTKKLKPFKRSEKGHIYQSNVERKIEV